MYGVPAKPHDATRYMYVLFDTADVRHRHTSTHALEEHETLYSFMCIDTWLAVITCDAPPTYIRARFMYESSRTAFSPIPSGKLPNNSYLPTLPTVGT